MPPSWSVDLLHWLAETSGVCNS